MGASPVNLAENGQSLSTTTSTIAPLPAGPAVEVLLDGGNPAFDEPEEEILAEDGPSSALPVRMEAESPVSALPPRSDVPRWLRLSMYSLCRGDSPPPELPSSIASYRDFMATHAIVNGRSTHFPAYFLGLRQTAYHSKGTAELMDHVYPSTQLVDCVFLLEEGESLFSLPTDFLLSIFPVERCYELDAFTLASSHHVFVGFNWRGLPTQFRGLGAVRSGAAAPMDKEDELSLDDNVLPA